jgi:hypothetical protein
MTTIRRFDCFSIWRRRIAKNQQREVVRLLRFTAGQCPERWQRAYTTAADILEKIADKYEQSGQDC